MVLTLLGQGPSMKGCPFDGETWSSLTVLGKKGWEDSPVSKVFCFDKPEHKADEMKGLKVAQERNIPIIGFSWMAFQNPVTDTYITESYPLREMIKEFDTYYYKNDMSLMIMLALSQGYKKLSLWGVDQGGGSPELEGIYVMARPYVMYWLGVATGMGVEWELAPDSILLREE